MGHEADENQIFRLYLLQLDMQGGSGEGVGQVFADDRLATGLRHLRRDLAACAVEIEGAAGLALMY